MGFGARVLTGKVVRDSDGEGLRGVRVRLVLTSNGRATTQDTHVSGAAGSFRLRLPEGGARGQVRITFEVDGASVRCQTPTKFPTSALPESGLEYRLLLPVAARRAVDATPSEPVDPGSVRGVVTHTNGTAVVGATVRLYQREVGATTLLDSATTGSDGEYTLTYTYTTPRDLFVVVLDADDNFVRLSRPMFGAAEHEIANIQVKSAALAGASEFARVDAVLSAPLASVDPATIGVDDAPYLANKHGLPLESVRAYLRATKVAPSVSISKEALFALLLSGGPSTAKALAALDPESVTRVLERAAAKGLVSSTIGADATDIADDLLGDMVGLVGAGTASNNFGGLLTHIAGLSNTKRDAVVREVLTNHRKGEDLFEAIAELPDFTTGDVDAVRRASTLATVCYGHVPLVRAFDTTYTAPVAYAAAGLTLANWRTLLDATVGGDDVDTPDWVVGATESDRRDAFAALVFQRAEHQFPSHRVASGFRAADPGDTTDLSKFLRDNPLVDLRKTNLTTFFETADLSAVGDAPALLDRVRKLQRLMRIAPTSDRLAVVQALESAGYGSAGAVARRSRESFVNRHATEIGEAKAKAVHARARKVVTRTQMYDLRTRYQEPIGIDEEQLPKSMYTEEPTTGSYMTLFGLPSCGCTSCQSVTSMSAYLVDVLHWLESQDNDAIDTSLYELLIGRRPDLAEVKLTCGNSETAMPQVDLAIEVFETAVVEASSGTATVPVRTTLTTDELLAMPEHENEAAYNILKAAAWPFVLPYDHAQRQQQVAFTHLGIDGDELLDLFPSTAPAAVERNALALGGSVSWGTLVTTETLTEPWTWWGFDGATGPHPLTEDSVDWFVALRYVPELLARLDLPNPSEDLLDLLHARYIQGSPNVVELVTEVAGSCDFANYYVGEVYDGTPELTPSAVTFTRMATFVRLQRVLGWSYLDLDTVLVALNLLGSDTQTNIDGAALGKLADLVRVRNLRPKLGLDELAAWFSGSLPTRLDRETKEEPRPPLYDRLFLDPSVVKVGSSPFRLNDARTELNSPGGAVLPTHEATLISALQTNQVDLQDAVALATVVLGHAVEKDLQDLTCLHAIVSSARHSGMSVRTMRRLSTAIGSPPYLSPAAAVTWFRHLEVWAESGLTPDALAWVLSLEPNASAALGPTEDTARAFLGALRDRLRALASEASAGTTLVDQETVRSDVATLVADPATVTAVIDAIATAEIADDLVPVQEALGDWLPSLAPLLTYTLPDEIGLRWGWVHEKLSASLLLVRQKDAIHTAVADTWGVSAVVAAAICEQTIAAHSRSVDETLTHEDFLTVGDDEAATAPWADLLPAVDGDAFEVVSWLARVAHLVSAWTLDDTFVQRWVADAARIGLLDLGALPVSDSVTGLSAKYAALYTTWRLRSASADLAWSTSLSALAAGHVSGFADQLVAGHGWVRETIDPSLVERDLGTVVFTSSVDRTDSTDEIVVVLAGVVVTASPSPDWASTSEALLALKDEIAATGALDTVVVADCLNASGAVTTGGTPAVALRVQLHTSQTVVHDLTSPTLVATPTLYTPETLWRAMRRLALCAKHGVSDAELSSWALTEPDLSDAARVRQAVRAKYEDPKRWSAVWRPVRDQIRRSQQAALLAWLRTNDPTATTNDELYAKYLIDGEMDPINLTTRIQQAIASTQLFVQRVSLGLEDGCSLDEENAERWEWMRSWRVWEAARKVWLYPENWIEPELRVEKSELFEAFEQDLLSGDLTNEAAEKALVRYIRQLKNVATPAIAGMCSVAVDTEDGSADVRTVHVFAQTRQTPVRTYFRTFVEKARWTPWSEVKVGVTGKSLCPVVYQGRLLLFWHELTELEGQDENENVNKYVRVKVCWSEYVDGEWSERRETGEVSTEQDDYGTVKEHRWSLRAILVGGVLRVDLLQVAKVKWDDGEILADDEYREVVEKCWEFNPVSGNLVKGNLPTPVRWSLRALDSSVRNSGYRIPASPTYRESSITEDTDGDDAEPTIDRLYMPFSKQDGDTDAMYAICLYPYKTAMYVTPPRNSAAFNTDNAFVVHDAERAYLLDVTARDATYNKPVTVNGVERSDEDLGDATFVAHTMHHPYVGDMLERISTAGVSGLLASLPNTPLRYQATNDLDEEDKSTFERFYLTNNIVKGDAERLPLDEFDFGFTAAMGVYNWEIFFHSVTLVAERMRQNGRYEDALRWLHYVYDPRKKAEHRWRIKPLRGIETVAVDKWTAGLADEGTAEIDVLAYEAWLDNPFDPHIVAMGRPSAYQRFTIKRYVEIVLDWADSRFATDGREAINEAAQLYLYARDILGPAAPKPPETTLAVERSFASMRTSLDTFSNRIVQLENAVPTVAWMQVPAKEPGPIPFESVTFEYFCTPPSEVVELLRSRIDDRLFKIRHSMNIDGVVRTLPIFEPAIDPAALVRAAASGASLGSVVNASSGPPLYRFTASLGRAKELAGVASALGNALLSQLEKKDSERLSNMRERQDLRMQKLTKDVRELQVEEAEASLAAAEAAKDSVEVRKDYYQALVDSLPLPEEDKADDAFRRANFLNGLAVALDGGAAAITALFPDITAKVGLPEATWGGSQKGAAFHAISRGLGGAATGLSAHQGKLERDSSRKLRKQDWQQQVEMAESEVKQHEELIASAKTRVQVAQRELRNHERQIKHVEERIDFLSRKFTNTELYGWMIGTTSQIHSQTYQMALEVARQAEAAYRYELGVTTASFVSYSNWDSLRKGALAGERLAFDLARMERAYLDNDRRELQITKHVSLAQLDPIALQQLKDNRSCFFRVPEVLFDLDFPGHYFRRLKGVTVSVPCVAGPYVGINATLSLQQTHTRVSTALDEDVYAYDPAAPGDRIRVDTSVESIAISGAQDESGVFNFDFNSGARFVPFERRGVIGHWQLELTSPYPSFDPQSIGDVVLTLRYTARDGGVPLRDAVIEELPALVANYDGEAANVGTGFRRALSARHDFPDAWHALLNPADGAETLAMSFELGPEHFPVGMRTPGLTVVKVDVAMVRKTGAVVTLGDADVNFVFGSFDDPALTLAAASPAYGVLYAEAAVEESVTAPVAVELTMTLTEAVASGFGSGSPTRLDTTKLEDIVFVVHYVLETPA